MDPLFVENLATLQAHLRLSEVDSDTDVDANDLIARAVRSVRVKFRQRLSQARIEQIQAIIQADPVDPDTDNEYLRELAELTEINWVHLELTYLLPVLFEDSSASARDVYMEEAPFRKADQTDLDVLRDKLRQDIEESMDTLVGTEGIDDTTSLRAQTLGPTDSKRVGYFGQFGR